MNSTTPSSSPTHTKKEILPNNDKKTNFLNTPNITPKQYIENNVLTDINKSLTSNLMKSFEPKKIQEDINSSDKKAIYNTPNVSPPLNQNEKSISNHPPLLLSHAKNLFSNIESKSYGNFDKENITNTKSSSDIINNFSNNSNTNNTMNKQENNKIPENNNNNNSQININKNQDNTPIDTLIDTTNCKNQSSATTTTSIDVIDSNKNNITGNEKLDNPTDINNNNKMEIDMINNKDNDNNQEMIIEPSEKEQINESKNDNKLTSRSSFYPGC